MENLKKTRAFKCKTCFDWDNDTKKCKSQVPITANFIVDSFGTPICKAHRNKQTGKLTGGFKELKERTKVWFTSDFHFSHANILYFHPKRREFLGMSLEELKTDSVAAVNKMNDKLIQIWNDTVKRSDTVYFLGDFCLGNREETERILQKLHGKKFLITGNHDKSLKGLERYFEDVAQIKEAKFTNNQFPFIDENEPFCVEMCHFPLLTWNRRSNGSVHVHGHCHSSIDDMNTISKELRVDVGIDSKLANYKLIELEELYNYFIDIRNSLGCSTFKEYTTKLINERNGIKG